MYSLECNCFLLIECLLSGRCRPLAGAAIFGFRKLLIVDGVFRLGTGFFDGVGSVSLCLD